MFLNEFIFETGTWLGEGKISFSASPEFIKFYTRWKIDKIDDNLIKAVQIVEMLGVPDQLVNNFTITAIKPHSFVITLENNVVEKITGKGLRDDKSIAWEFRGEKDFEGFEVYERQENGDFFMHAEYGSPEQFRTLVEGLIWRKT
jgi:hypothetical protein